MRNTKRIIQKAGPFKNHYFKKISNRASPVAVGVRSPCVGGHRFQEGSACHEATKLMHDSY